MELKKRIDFSRNGAGISQDPCKKKKNLDTENNIFHKIKLLFIHYPNYFHRKIIFFIPYKQ